MKVFASIGTALLFVSLAASSRVRITGTKGREQPQNRSSRSTQQSQGQQKHAQPQPQNERQNQSNQQHQQQAQQAEAEAASTSNRPNISRTRRISNTNSRLAAQHRTRRNSSIAAGPAGAAETEQPAAPATGAAARDSRFITPRNSSVSQQAAWQEHRSQNWHSDHRNWQQRGGYNGYRIPENRYNGYFGPNYAFVIYNQPYMVVGGFPRFQYGGYWFSVVDPWPNSWANNWYQTDDVYVVYANNGYYMYNRRHPNVGIAISVSL